VCTNRISLSPDPQSARPWRLCIAMSLLMLSGCGFVLHGGKQDITFDSKPPGVTVTLDNATQFTTPHTIALTRLSNHQALFKKEGYETQRLSIKHEFLIGPAIVGNILPFFPVGLAVDVMTGAAWGFERDYLAVDMTPSGVRP
jgi:hypothetical protein